MYHLHYNPETNLTDVNGEEFDLYYLPTRVTKPIIDGEGSSSTREMISMYKVPNSSKKLHKLKRHNRDIDVY